MLHVTFRHISQLLNGHDTYADAYANFLNSAVVPPSLQDDINVLEQQQYNDSVNDDSTDDDQVMLLTNVCMLLLFMASDLTQ